MSTLNLGKLRFNWRGVYDSAQTYTRNDTVKYQQNSFVCIATTTTGAFNGAHWAVMAEGMHPATTEGDLITFENGNLVRKPIGTAGQVLHTKAGKATWEHSPLIQARIFKDRVRRGVASGAYYYFGSPTETGNSITTMMANSVLQFDVSILTESNTHDTHLQFQYNAGSGWAVFPLVNEGQQGHLKIGQYPDSDYNSTPSSEYGSQALALNLPAGTTVSFRILCFNGGTTIFCGSQAGAHESAPCQLTITELNPNFASVVERTV